MILVLTNADTEILALRMVVEGLPEGFPAVRAANPDRLGDGLDALDALPPLDNVDMVLVRLLGGRGSWPDAFDGLTRRCRTAGIPLLAVGGEASPDPELMAASTVPSATVAQAFAYWVAGGPANLEQLLRFVADSVLMEGFGFDAPVELPLTARWGEWPRTGRPRIGVILYRAHVLSGNTGFVDDLCAAIDAAGADPVPISTYSLRPDADGEVPAVDLLAQEGVDVVVTTVLAMGHGDADGDGWIVPRLPDLDVPVVQALCATRSRDEWEGGDRGLTPMDAAMQVAIPEFDGRIITVPVSFKEVVDDGDVLGAEVTAYRAVPDRVARVAGIAVRLARLRHLDPADAKVAVVLSAYPTKRARLGNAVGLDTPASVVDLLDAMKRAGYRVDRIPGTGDELMAELADRLTYDRATLTAEQAERAVGAMDPAAYGRWFATLPKDRRDEMVEHHGEAPGTAYIDGDDRQLFTGIDLGGVLVCIQPPRGFGEDPIAIYHDPDLPPTHHYLGFYRWLDEVWGADAVVHVGKHGTLEWLPGKGLGMSAGCYPDAALGDMPFFYPFIVNDPGEGTQAKRRAHAVVIDHLLPPMTRAETYDELARLEDLLDAHAHFDALDPSKLPAIRRQVWDLLVEAELHRDLGLEGGAPDGDAFNDLILHVDGYLCELKDARIRGGLHTLGVAPAGEALVDLVLALTRLPQGGVPALTSAVDDRLFGSSAAASHMRRSSALAVADAVEAECRRLVEEARDAGWTTNGDDPTIAWVCDTLVPALTRTTDEIGHLLHGLAGGHVPSGPSGAPSRGMAHVLPTGRNFYSVDPKSVPSPLAWEVGVKLADALVARHVTEEGRAPTTVGLVLWGTAAMRTSGDDAAQALALLGVRPVWDDISGRVTGLETIDPEELGRPRVDVTLRISGFFRDAFPNLITLLDDAVRLVAALDELPEHNPIRAHGIDDPRVFGPRPGGYGSGILSLLESGSWRDDDDLAAVYETWGGFAYGRDRFGQPAPEAMRRRFAAIQVAVKNQDNREHDIFDSDDYLQDHGGMVATVRALTGAQPKAWFGDTSDPNRPRVRSLEEEAARVVRTRVINPKWIEAMKRHGYKGAFELAATVDYLFGYDATAHVVQDWMYERVTQAYVADAEVRAFFERSNPWALRSIAERLLEARDRGLWDASHAAVATLRSALLEAEGWEEDR